MFAAQQAETAELGQREITLLCVAVNAVDGSASSAKERCYLVCRLLTEVAFSDKQIEFVRNVATFTAIALDNASQADELGIVKASSDAGWTEQDSVNYAVEELKNQAAKLGANGVFIETTGEQTSTIIGGQGTGYLYAIPVSAQTVSGKAIFVSE